MRVTNYCNILYCISRAFLPLTIAKLSTFKNGPVFLARPVVPLQAEMFTVLDSGWCDVCKVWSSGQDNRHRCPLTGTSCYVWSSRRQCSNMEDCGRITTCVSWTQVGHRWFLPCFNKWLKICQVWITKNKCDLLMICTLLVVLINCWLNNCLLFCLRIIALF